MHVWVHVWNIVQVYRYYSELPLGGIWLLSSVLSMVARHKNILKVDFGIREWEMKRENWQEMAISLCLKWLWAGSEEEMHLNFVLWISLSLWVKAPKYKGAGTTVSTMVSCGCMLIIHTFNPILLFFFSLLCFLSFLFCKCQGLVRWPPFCGCLGHAEPQVSTGSTLLLKGVTWCTRGEAGFSVGPAFWCQHTVTLQLICLIKQWGQKNHLWVVH